MTSRRMPAGRLALIILAGLVLPVAIFLLVWVAAGVATALIVFVALYVLNLVVGATMILKGRKAIDT
jgi:hypothetical protein